MPEPEQSTENYFILCTTELANTFIAIFIYHAKLPL